MFLKYIKNEINNNSILFLLHSNIYFENILLNDLDNAIRINKYYIDSDDYLLEKILNTYSIKKRTIIITDTNSLNIKIIKKIINTYFKSNNNNIKLIFCVNRQLDKITKKLNKKNIKIKSLKNFKKINIKYLKHKIRDDKFYKNIELYDNCKNILQSRNYDNFNELYNLFLMEKVYIPLTIHNNYHKFTDDEYTINEYLDIFCVSEQIQDLIFKDGYKELLYIYFIITCIIPSKMLKNKNTKKNIKLNFSNIISYMSILIRKNKNFYMNLRKTKIYNLDKKHIEDKIEEINKNRKLMKEYKIDKKTLNFFIKYFNIL